MGESLTDKNKKDAKEIDKETQASHNAAVVAKRALAKLDKLESFSSTVKKELSKEPD